MGTRKLITFYKSQVLKPFFNYLNERGYKLEETELNQILKLHADLPFDLSCKEMEVNELQELIHQSFIYAESFGCYLNFLDNEADFIREL